MDYVQKQHLNSVPIFLEGQSFVWHVANPQKLRRGIAMLTRFRGARLLRPVQASQVDSVPHQGRSYAKKNNTSKHVTAAHYNVVLKAGTYEHRI